MKTREEKYPELEKEKIERERGERKLTRDEERKKVRMGDVLCSSVRGLTLDLSPSSRASQKEADLKIAAEKAAAEDIRSYSDVFSHKKNLTKTNHEMEEEDQKTFQDYEEDFM